MNVLSVEHLSFQFNKQRSHFFKNLNTSFADSNLHFIQGKNGSGKSTFFRILQGDIHQDEQVSGTILLNEKRYTLKNNTVPSELLDHIHSVRQNIDLMIADQFSVSQNLSFAQLPRYPGFTVPKLPQKSMCTLLSNFNIDLDTHVHRLSGGQRQILAISMVLQRPTKILLLDEPTSALDPKNTQMVMDCLQKIAQSLEITVIIITHDKELVSNYTTHGYHELFEQADGIRAIHHRSI